MLDGEMNEAEYQKQFQDFCFDIKIYEGLISGLICLEIIFSVMFVLALLSGLTWYISLFVYCVISGILIFLICSCFKAIESCKRGIKDLAQPFG